MIHAKQKFQIVRNEFPSEFERKTCIDQSVQTSWKFFLKRYLATSP